MRKTALIAAAALITAWGGSATAQTVTDIAWGGSNPGGVMYYMVGVAGTEIGNELPDVNITQVTTGGSTENAKRLIKGELDMGIVYGSHVYMSQTPTGPFEGGDKGTMLRGVAMAYQGPTYFVTLGGSGIESLSDLEGKKVADSAFSAMPLLFPAYAKAASIDAKKVEWITADGSTLPALLARGQVDVIGQYIVGEPLLAKAVAPKTLVRLGYAEAGLDYYGNGLVATEAMIKADPDTVKAFIRATYKGLADALANPAEAGEIMHKYQKQVSAEIATAETEKVGELVRDYDGKTGAIDPAQMAKTVSVVESAYKLSNPVKAEDVYVPGFVE